MHFNATPSFIFMNTILGIFGGASIESGFEDPQVLLLAVRGFVYRNLQFVEQLLAQQQRGNNTTTHPKHTSTVTSTSPLDCVPCNLVSDEQASRLLTNLWKYADICVKKVYSEAVYVTGNSESMANGCLDTILQRSKGLFRSMEQTMSSLREVSKRNRTSLYHCCVF